MFHRDNASVAFFTAAQCDFAVGLFLGADHQHIRHLLKLGFANLRAQLFGPQDFAQPSLRPQKSLSLFEPMFQLLVSDSDGVLTIPKRLRFVFGGFDIGVESSMGRSRDDGQDNYRSAYYLEHLSLLPNR